MKNSRFESVLDAVAKGFLRDKDHPLHGRPFDLLMRGDPKQPSGWLLEQRKGRAIVARFDGYLSEQTARDSYELETAKYMLRRVLFDFVRQAENQRSENDRSTDK